HALGGQVHYVPLGAAFPARFRRLLRERGYDVVQSHVHYFSGLILRLAADERIPVRITHFRNTDDGRRSTLPRVAYRLLNRFWINRYSTHILAVSRGAMSAAWPWHERDPRCRVLYNGLDL